MFVLGEIVILSYKDNYKDLTKIITCQDTKSGPAYIFHLIMKRLIIDTCAGYMEI